MTFRLLPYVTSLTLITYVLIVSKASALPPHARYNNNNNNKAVKTVVKTLSKPRTNEIRRSSNNGGKLEPKKRCIKSDAASAAGIPKPARRAPITKCEVKVKNCYDMLLAHGGKTTSAKKDMVLVNCVKIYPCTAVKKRICIQKELLTKKMLQMCQQWKLL